MKFILLINVKMPTIVGILTFISRINTASESLKAREFSVFQHLSFYEQLKFYAQLSWAWKKFYNLGAWTSLILKIQDVPPSPTSPPVSNRSQTVCYDTDSLVNLGMCTLTEDKYALKFHLFSFSYFITTLRKVFTYIPLHMQIVSKHWHYWRIRYYMYRICFVTGCYGSFRLQGTIPKHLIGLAVILAYFRITFSLM